MMKRFFVILISCLWLAVPLFAQSNKLIRELESKRIWGRLIGVCDMSVNMPLINVCKGKKS